MLQYEIGLAIVVLKVGWEMGFHVVFAVDVAASKRIPPLHVRIVHH